MSKPSSIVAVCPVMVADVLDPMPELIAPEVGHGIVNEFARGAMRDRAGDDRWRAVGIVPVLDVHPSTEARRPPRGYVPEGGDRRVGRAQILVDRHRRQQLQPRVREPCRCRPYADAGHHHVGRYDLSGVEMHAVELHCDHAHASAQLSAVPPVGEARADLS